MVHRSRNKVLQNDMQITANCTIRSCVYGHILVLNLHSTCASHLGKISLLFWFITYLFNSPFFFVLLDFSLYIRYLLSVSLWNSPTWYRRFFIWVCTSTSINSISILIASLHFITWSLVRMQLFLFLYSLFVFLKWGLLFFDTVYCIILRVWNSVFNFPGSWHFYWVASRICVSSCTWRFIRCRQWLNCYCFCRNTAVNWFHWLKLRSSLWCPCWLLCCVHVNRWRILTKDCLSCSLTNVATAYISTSTLKYI
jgi:hypothetical protein